MSKIIHLIRRDFMVQRRQKTFVMPIILSVVAAVILASSPSFAVGTIIMATYFLTIYVNAYDFKYNTELGYRSLPIRRSSLVISRYMAVWVFTGAALAISIAASMVLNFGGWPGVSFQWTLPLVGLTVASIAFYYALFFPIYFQLGYMKSRWANYFAMIALYSVLGALQSRIADESRLPGIVLSEMLNTPLLVILLAIAFAVFILSMLISIKIYSNKEVGSTN